MISIFKHVWALRSGIILSPIFASYGRASSRSLAVLPVIFISRKKMFGYFLAATMAAGNGQRATGNWQRQRAAGNGQLATATGNGQLATATGNGQLATATATGNGQRQRATGISKAALIKIKAAAPETTRDHRRPKRRRQPATGILACHSERP